MKKQPLFLLFACILLLAMSSCKKDWICTCTITYYDTNHNVTGTEDENDLYEEMTRSEASQKCDEMDNDSGLLFTSSCDLKAD